MTIPAGESMSSGRYDVVVVGAGLAGLTAAATAIAAGVSVALVHGGSGSFALGGGCVASRSATDPAPDAATEAALARFTAFARDAGYPFRGHLTDRRELPTLLGALQPIAIAPLPVATAADARGRVALVGFVELPFFDVDFMAARLNGRGRPGVTYVPRWVALPADAGPLGSTLHVANRFDRDPDFRQALIATLRPVADDVDALVLPGILGQRTRLADIDAFAHALDRPLGELPTLPPSVPGLRLFRALHDRLVEAGVECLSGFPVTALVPDRDRCFDVTIDAPGRPRHLTAQRVVLASGRHSRGLLGEMPATVDARLQPCDGGGAPLFRGVHLAGSILPGDDRRRGDEHAILTGHRAGLLALGEEASHAT